MIRTSLLLFLLFAGVLPSPLAAQDFPALFSVSGVAPDDSLNIRAAPDPAAPIIGTLPFDASGVEVVSVTDGWAKINSGEGTGHVALSYLMRDDGAAWFTLQQPLFCFGTEPFWSLELDAANGLITRKSPEVPAPLIDRIGDTWPGKPWSPAAAIALPDGLAVLRPADCSDGMSDMTYGIALDVFLNGPDGRRLSGCCTLALR
ncbi:SH3 domain-containing protein [Tabrizicola sp.]|uniref:COG3650 family protein n=1 Tax=Tabrizicola sp. TaxID=2005166 RepID=UPI002636C472|nr:SH3 domain-containing protein [Tabrizicola sp.]MDM7931612.1 SH3 domain-containing protein [Tabrizicola sp.]